MTFEEFQATRTHCDDLARALETDMGAPDGHKVPGNLYDGTLFIEARAEWWSESGKAQGAWQLILENDCVISDDLEALERQLYDWSRLANDEGGIA